MNKIGLCSLSLFLFLISCNKESEDTPSPEPSISDSTRLENQLKTGLWAVYDFNEGISDKSGNNHFLSAQNGLSLSYDMWGNANSALFFDGINDYAVIEDGKNFPEGDFTIALKVMPVQAKGRIFQKANYNTAKGASFNLSFFETTSELTSSISKDLDVCDVYTDINNVDPLMTSKHLQPYSWYHIIMMHEKGVQKMYLNGKLLASAPTALASTKHCSSATFNIGVWWINDPRYFNGKVDDLKIYTRALNQEEVEFVSRYSMKK